MWHRAAGARRSWKRIALHRFGGLFKVDHCRDDQSALLNGDGIAGHFVLFSASTRNSVATPQTRIEFQIYLQVASRTVTIERRDDPSSLQF